jgi:hypothetical protein
MKELMAPTPAVYASGAAPAGTRDINAVMAGFVDRGPWKYYDTLNTAAGTTLQSTYSMFSIPIGGTDPILNTTKTKLQTNMQRGNQFPPPRCLVMMQLGFEFKGMLLADILAFIKNYYIEFKIDDKIFYEGLMEFYPSGYGMFGNSSLSGDYTWGLGFPAPQAGVRWGEYSKYIAPLQQFSLNLYAPQTIPTLTTTLLGGTGLQLIPFMDGLTDRSVQ